MHLALATVKRDTALMRATVYFFLVTLLSLIATSTAARQDYPAAVKSVMESRCMVCHGCYDAPCQLKLDAWEGLLRGAHQEKIYDGDRLQTARLSRLFEDATTVQEWREKGFYPVVNTANAERSTLTRMLDLKQQQPLPDTEILPDSFDLRLNRDQQCTREEDFDDYARDYPLWGMPYALPGLNDQEHNTLANWLAAGAPAAAETSEPSAAETTAVKDWESFLNGPSLKQKLMSRYIYEHLFVGNLHFSDLGTASGYYTIVRSRTPPTQPIDIIATRRPYDSPGTDTFYYRLQPMHLALLDKRHMPYALSKSRMQRWQGLFLNTDYKVSALPSYKTKEAANPFLTFRELPQTARYKFMLEEAQFTIMGFIKGPVCRGQVALNVIDDHFWVVFLDPDKANASNRAEFLARENLELLLPSGDSNALVSLIDWRKYARHQKKFLRAKTRYIKQHTTADDPDLDLGLIWDGDGHNHNAALTIFRHFDSASVVKGLVGQQPKTAWVMDYSLLERIHYVLVAGFDVYGNVGHQLETRLYMDFLRMEGEQNFLYFLPAQTRIALRDFWYRDAGDHIKQFVLKDSVAFDRDSDIEYKTDDPKAELLALLQRHVPAESGRYYQVQDQNLVELMNVRGAALGFLPEVSFVDVLTRDGSVKAYSLIHNRAFSNNAHLFGEDRRRIPAEDSVTVAKGFIGSYPNVFFQFPQKHLPGFVSSIASLSTEEDYAKLVSRFGVRRTAPWFWHLSDKLHTHYKTIAPVEAGLFDLNRYENR